MQCFLNELKILETRMSSNLFLEKFRKRQFIEKTIHNMIFPLILFLKIIRKEKEKDLLILNTYIYF